MSFHEINHTADRGLEIEAATLEGVFAEAAAALAVVYAGGVSAIGAGTKTARREIDIRVGADTQADLLVVFLNEIVFRTEREKRVFTGAEVRITAGESDRYVLTGTIFYDTILHLKTEIKGVTYHQLELFEEAGRWVARIIIDV